MFTSGETTNTSGSRHTVAMATLHTQDLLLIIIIIIIIYHDFLPTQRRGSHVKSGKTHTVIKIHPLAHILDS